MDLRSTYSIVMHAHTRSQVCSSILANEEMHVSKSTQTLVEAEGNHGDTVNSSPACSSTIPTLGKAGPPSLLPISKAQINISSIKAAVAQGIVSHGPPPPPDLPIYSPPPESPSTTTAIQPIHTPLSHRVHESHPRPSTPKGPSDAAPSSTPTPPTTDSKHPSYHHRPAAATLRGWPPDSALTPAFASLTTPVASPTKSCGSPDGADELLVEALRRSSFGLGLHLGRQQQQEQQQEQERPGKRQSWSPLPEALGRKRRSSEVVVSAGWEEVVGQRD